MKKLFFALLVAAVSVTAATAKPSLKNLNNYGKATTIVLVDDEAPADAKVASAVFHNDGKDLPSKSVKVERKDGKTLITMKFKRCTFFKDTSVSLEINGKSVTVPLNLNY